MTEETYYFRSQKIVLSAIVRFFGSYTLAVVAFMVLFRPHQGLSERALSFVAAVCLLIIKRRVCGRPERDLDNIYWLRVTVKDAEMELREPVWFLRSRTRTTAWDKISIVLRSEKYLYLWVDGKVYGLPILPGLERLEQTVKQRGAALFDQPALQRVQLINTPDKATVHKIARYVLVGKTDQAITLARSGLSLHGDKGQALVDQIERRLSAHTLRV